MFRSVSFFIVLLTFVLVQDAHSAQGDAQIARFEKYLKVLRAPLKSSHDPDVVTNALLNTSPARVAAFQLQALGGVYESQDPYFDTIRRAFKLIEDYIGKLDKEKNDLEYAYDELNEAIDQGLSTKEIKKREDEVKSVEEKIKKSTKKFSKKLVEENLVNENGKKSLFDEIEEFLLSYPWLSYKDDKNQMLNQMSDQLLKVNSTSYDLTRLEKDLTPFEDGNGLHELRREIRKYNQQAISLNGMVTYRATKACPVKSLEGFEKDVFDLVHPSDHNNIEKYASLPSSITEENPCEISKCLNYAIVYAVYSIGEIKDEVEKINWKKSGLDQDTVPKKQVKQAQAIYQWVRSNDLLKALSDELLSCRE